MLVCKVLGICFARLPRRVPGTTGRRAEEGGAACGSRGGAREGRVGGEERGVPECCGVLPSLGCHVTPNFSSSLHPCCLAPLLPSPPPLPPALPFSSLPSAPHAEHERSRSLQIPTADAAATRVARAAKRIDVCVAGVFLFTLDVGAEVDVGAVRTHLLGEERWHREVGARSRANWTRAAAAAAVSYAIKPAWPTRPSAARWRGRGGGEWAVL